MIILSEVCQPADGVRLTQPQVVAYMENESVGEGTLCVAESQVTWICRTSGLGFSLTYPSIILHAISTDISTFPYECVYIVVDASKSGKFFLRFVYIWTAYVRDFVFVRNWSLLSIVSFSTSLSFFVAGLLLDLKLADVELNHTENTSDDEEDSEDGSKNVIIRFVPSDINALQQIYNEMCVCQELNPDENDDFS
ncbi:hypothetical protein Angca_006177, partial [Angiostrongylus cantonensis]